MSGPSKNATYLDFRMVELGPSSSHYFAAVSFLIDSATGRVLGYCPVWHVNWFSEYTHSILEICIGVREVRRVMSAKAAQDHFYGKLYRTLKTVCLQHKRIEKLAKNGRLADRPPSGPGLLYDELLDLQDLFRIRSLDPGKSSDWSDLPSPDENWTMVARLDCRRPPGPVSPAHVRKAKELLRKHWSIEPYTWPPFPEGKCVTDKDRLRWVCLAKRNHDSSSLEELWEDIGKEKLAAILTRETGFHFSPNYVGELCSKLKLKSKVKKGRKPRKDHEKRS